MVVSLLLQPTLQCIGLTKTIWPETNIPSKHSNCKLFCCNLIQLGLLNVGTSAVHLFWHQSVLYFYFIFSWHKWIALTKLKSMYQRSNEQTNLIDISESYWVSRNTKKISSKIKNNEIFRYIFNYLLIHVIL